MASSLPSTAARTTKVACHATKCSSAHAATAAAISPPRHSRRI